MTSKVEISHKTIVFTVLFLILLWLLLQIREIIFLVYIAFILMSAFKPLADFLEKIHIPRVFSVLAIYILVITTLGFAGSSVIPLLVSQSIHLAERMPQYVGSVLPFIKIDEQIITQQIAPIGQNLVKVTIGLFSNVITLFSIIVISFYLLIERQRLEKQLASFMGEEGAKKMMLIIVKIEERLGAWVRGQLTMGITIGVATFIGLSILNLPYALALAILAGILEIIPIIGPIISAIPAIFVALTISPFVTVMTVITYFLIQQVEAHLVVPMVMQKAVGLHPLVTIIALMIGANLSGIGGALLAVPIVVTAESILSEYLKLKEAK